MHVYYELKNGAVNLDETFWLFILALGHFKASHIVKKSILPLVQPPPPRQKCVLFRSQHNMSILNIVQNRVNLIVMLVWGTNRRILGKGNVVWGSFIAGIGIVLR